ncbi:MAG: DNA replication/repair protein RecF [Peptococcaceae bacterium]|jgi:DNA replication and repair protein RecF|nr:DNA replication/repair protein RecF [Peptococcaceae bacterium]
MIKDIDMYHFRNLQQQKICFSPGLNILTGKNGQGKTNLLEALFYLLTGKSYRAQKELELIRWGEDAFRLNGSFNVNGREIRLESVYTDKKKMIKVNGVACRRLSDFIGLINVVFFSPDDLSIIKDSPGKRRLFIDAHIIQLRPSYVGVLNDYNRILTQKGHLLREDRAGFREKQEQLELWNEELVKYGSEVLKLRCEHTNRLKRIAAEIYQQISFDAEKMDMAYLPLGCKDIETALAEFPLILQKKKESELERRTILVGPHRDELEVSLDQRNGRLFASQGQQRSIVLALKLAQLHIIKQEKETYPLLLLDDVLSELDQFRRKYLIHFIESLEIQTVMTNALDEKEERKGTVYLVENGEIKPM